MAVSAWFVRAILIHSNRMARFSSVVRAFTHGVMGRQIDPLRGMCYPVCAMVPIK